MTSAVISLARSLDRAAGIASLTASVKMVVVKRAPPRPRPPRALYTIQGGWGGWPTGNGKKLRCSQAQLGQATCLAVA